MLPLFPDPDGLPYLSLKSVLFTIFDRCLLPAYYMISVHNVVCDSWFITKFPTFYQIFMTNSWWEDRHLPTSPDGLTGSWVISLKKCYVVTWNCSWGMFTFGFVIMNFYFNSMDNPDESIQRCPSFIQNQTYQMICKLCSCMSMRLMAKN